MKTLCNLCGSELTNQVLKADEFSIFQCPNCKIAFTHPAPVVPDYSQMDFHSGENAEKAEKQTGITDLPEDWQKLIHKQVRLISQKLSTDARILEIGCGEGILLNELQKQGFKNVRGIEPSKTAAARARKKNLEVENKYFDGTSSGEKFDLVMMSHVLEHIADPAATLMQIGSVLKPGGYVMLTQTNYKALIPSVIREKWYAWVPDQHFWHFTPMGLRKMFRSVGLQPRDITFMTLVHPKDRLYKIAKLLPFLQDQFVILGRKIA